MIHWHDLLAHPFSFWKKSNLKNTLLHFSFACRLLCCNVVKAPAILHTDKNTGNFCFILRTYNTRTDDCRIKGAGKSKRLVVGDYDTDETAPPTHLTTQTLLVSFPTSNFIQSEIEPDVWHGMTKTLLFFCAIVPPRHFRVCFLHCRTPTPTTSMYFPIHSTTSSLL